MIIDKRSHNLPILLNYFGEKYDHIYNYQPQKAIFI